MADKIDNSEDAVQVINEIVSGNNDAFILLKDKFNRQLARYVWDNAGGVIGKEDISDIINDTWTDVYAIIKDTSSKRRYDQTKASFYTYLTNMARYKILDRLRHNYMLADMDRNEADGENNSDIECIPDNDETIPENVIIHQTELDLILNAYLEVLRIVFLCGGYPHQQLAFAISKLMFGRQSARGIEGKLELIYNEFSSIPLLDIYHQNVRNFYKSSQRGDKMIFNEMMKIFNPLEGRFPLLLADLMSQDKPSMNFYMSIINKRAQDTCFKDYYKLSKNSEIDKSAIQISNTVANWILKLEQRVRNVLGMATDRTKVKMHVGSFTFDHEHNDYENLEIDAASCDECKFRKITPCNKIIS